MDIHAIVCTRDRDKINPVTHRLVEYFVKCGIKLCIMSAATSIFSAYKGAFDHIKPNPDDILIFCHDDIDIREDPKSFIDKLKKLLEDDSVGFAGIAGTTYLSQNAVWWNQEYWKMGKHRGKVTHVDPQGVEYLTNYGPPEEVAVMDGLFLAAKPKVLEDVGLDKPDYFTGEWDFYDIYYTSQAFLKGYTNKILDIEVVHYSVGELVGRDSWHMNREAFIAHNPLPLELHP